MKTRLIRAAIVLYPASWRERYGAEMEQFVLDATADAEAGHWTAFRLILELAVGALAERARLHSQRAGIALPVTAVAVLVAVVAVARAGSGNEVTTQLPAHRSVGNWQIVPTTLIGPDVVVVSNARAARRYGSQEVVVRLHRPAGTIASVSGAPARVVINPASDRIISITREPGKPMSSWH